MPLLFTSPDAPALGILSSALTLLFILDPIGNIPVFHAVLRGLEPRERTRVIVRELLIALGILLAFLWGGTQVLGFLGLQQPSLNIAGGILLFLIALRMVFPTPNQWGEEDAQDPFIVPLAVPFVAGPSTIATLLLISSAEPRRMVDSTLALLIAWGITAATLLASPVLLRRLGQRGLRALERLMGMLLILVSVQMFLNGLTSYLESLPP